MAADTIRVDGYYYKTTHSKRRDFTRGVLFFNDSTFRIFRVPNDSVHLLDDLTRLTIPGSGKIDISEGVFKITEKGILELTYKIYKNHNVNDYKYVTRMFRIIDKSRIQLIRKRKEEFKFKILE